MWSFRHSPVAIGAFAVLFVCLAAAFLAPLLAPYNPFDLKTLNLSDALSPPRWLAGGNAGFLLGTDDQGRDLLSAIMYGARVSLIVGMASVALAMALGVSLGLIAGYAGGRLDAFIMRVADVQLSFPAILIALLIDGADHDFAPAAERDGASPGDRDDQHRVRNPHRSGIVVPGRRHAGDGAVARDADPHR